MKVQVELEWLKKRWDLSVEEKIKLIDNQRRDVSIHRQYEILGIHRSNYYEKQPVLSDWDKILMDEIDKINTKCPFYGRPRKLVEYIYQRIYYYNKQRIHSALKMTPDAFRFQFERRIYPLPV